MIVRTFMGMHIDLSKIVAITDAYFINRMGNGGYFVGFDIHCQLLDEPIKYERKVERTEVDPEDHLKVLLVNGEPFDLRMMIFEEDEKSILAVHNLQNQIDELIAQWKSIKEGEEK